MSAIIIAKGPSAIKIRKKDYPQQHLVAINQACKLIDRPDYVFMNDLESLKGLSSKDILNAKCFVIPEFPHKNCRAWRDTTKDDFIVKLKELNYQGEIQTFNLHTGPTKKDNLVTTISDCITTTHTAIYYMSKVYGVKSFVTYGFLIINKDGYQDNQFYEHTNNNETEQQIKNVYKKRFTINRKALDRIVKSLQIEIELK